MIHLLLLAVLASLIAATPAVAQAPNGEAFWIADGYPYQKRLGPAQAKGVVLYMHGIAANKDSYHHALPSYVQLLRLDGWEILRHNRSNTQDRLYDSTRAILKAVRELKAAGYRKIVLTGQSRGAWFAVSVAGKSPDVFAAISTAPGGYGECIVRFVATETLTAGAHNCDQTTGAASGADIPRPRNLVTATPGPEVPRPLATLAGSWYGDYEDGAARLLAPTGFNSDGAVTAFYAGAPRPGTDSQPFSCSVTAHLEGGVLLFRESAEARSSHAQQDGAVIATQTPDSGKPLEMVM